MREGDIVRHPDLRCRPAESARAIRHEEVENRLLLYVDEVLVEWLSDIRKLADLRCQVSALCGEMNGFSASELVPMLSPLSDLSSADRASLMEKLDRMFDSRAYHDQLALRVSSAVAGLVVARATFVRDSSDANKRADALAGVREAARVLHRELQALPNGFWLPYDRPSDVDGGERA